MARHDILVFSDAATLIAPDAIRCLVRHFLDPDVGVVCGALRFDGGAEHVATEGVYWKYETALRLMEGRLGATLTASGAMYAVRRSAFSPLKPETITDDLLVPMNARKRGFRVLFDPEAIATDFAAETVTDKLEELFRAEVFRLLIEKDLIGRDTVNNMLSWKHSGFSADASVRVETIADAVRLGRYITSPRSASQYKRSRTRGERIKLTRHDPNA